MTTPTLGAFDPLSAPCPRCEEPPGSRCGTVNAYSRKPHAARVKLARALAAHADPALDAHFPMRNPCGLCGSGLPQRHRVVDAIAGALEAGDGPEDLAVDYQKPIEAITAVQAWMKKWPGAWE